MWTPIDDDDVQRARTGEGIDDWAKSNFLNFESIKLQEIKNFNCVKFKNSQRRYVKYFTKSLSTIEKDNNYVD